MFGYFFAPRLFLDWTEFGFWPTFAFTAAEIVCPAEGGHAGLAELLHSAALVVAPAVAPVVAPAVALAVAHSAADVVVHLVAGEAAHSAGPVVVHRWDFPDGQPDA